MSLFVEALPKELVNLFSEYIDRIVKTSKTFSDGVKLLNEFRVGEARDKLAEASRLEAEADEIRKKLIALLEASRIDPGFKEDFFHMIKRMDDIADWFKEAARDLLIIPYLETPQPIREGLEKMIKLTVKASEVIAEAVKHALQGDYEGAEKLIKEVEVLEEEVDQINMENRGKLLELSDQIKPYTLAILLHDFNQDLEEAADACEYAGDYLRALLIAWKPM